MTVEDLPSLSASLAAAGLTPKKALGQNFLLDLNLCRRIARAAAPAEAEAVLEVGPGPGGLSRALLLEGAKQLVAIEKDEGAEALLAPIQRASDGRFSYQFADALTLDLRQLVPAPRLICANLPYNVATPLLTGWLKQISEVSGSYLRLVLMFQREVAERLVAKPGTKAYGRLSVLTQSLCQTEILFDVAPEAFRPPPKVVSSVVRLTPLAQPSLSVLLSKLEAVTAAAFGQRRKMLRQSLKSLGSAEALLEAAGIEGTRRAETLSLEEFERLAQAYAALRP